MSKNLEKTKPHETVSFPDYVYSKNNKSIWANTVDINGFGVLILGKSMAGKSDFSLRIIEDKTEIFGCEHENVRLVSDDRVKLEVKNKRLIAKSHDKIAGLLEINGLGIFKVDYCKNTEVKMVIELFGDDKIERMPNNYKMKVKTFSIPYFKLDPFSNTALIKLKYAILKVKSTINFI